MKWSFGVCLVIITLILSTPLLRIKTSIKMNSIKKDSPVDFFYKLMNYFGYIITHDEYMKSKFENEIPNIIDFETDMIMFLSQKLSTKTEYIQNPLFLYSILYNNNFF